VHSPIVIRGPSRTLNKKEVIMTRAVSFVLLAIGVVLIVWGINASESFASDVSRFFTGTATDKSIWFIVGGVAAAAFGLVGVLRGSRT
jgi:hypothetical protein